MGSHASSASPGGNGHPRPPAGDPTPFQRFVALLRPEIREIRVILVLSVITGVLYLATPLTVDAVVNNFAFGGEQPVYVQALIVLAVFLLFLLAMLGVLRAAQDYAMEIIQRRLFVRLTADVAYRLPRVPLEVLEAHQGPELVNRFFDVVTIQKSSSGLLLDGINVIFSTLIGLVVLGFYHPLLLLFALILLVLLVLVVFLPAKRAVRTSIEESYAKHSVVGWLEQIAMFPVLFRSSGAAEIACSTADRLAQKYLQARKAHFRVLMGQIASLLALQAVASAALLSIGGWLVLRAELTLGQLVASELIVAAIVAAISKLGKHLESWYDAMAAVNKLGYLVDLPVERSHGERPSAPDKGLSVQLQDLGYTHANGQHLLDALSLEIRPGTRVGIVSPGGLGGSALLDLMAGLREATSGRVLLNGTDLRLWQLGELRRQVFLVRGQEIVEGSILDNVRLGRPDLDIESVNRALEGVGLLGAIQQLPEGLETQLSPGGHPLSGSQRSRLILARAIIRKPRLLLVDEALDGLETGTLERLEAALFDDREPRTLVLVTRDPDLIQRCDQVLHLGDCHLSRPGHTPVSPSTP
ncbi:MAG: ABC transporter ATP-binding protein/permease [Verrucomicrobium sp.]|jgi:putative ABC transport system ATP-binding protein|nr:ABC transporter ATP-binding protein/permease [Verrucomicrobium sp.]